MNKIQFKKKIIIGTANFTQEYGLKSIILKTADIKKIFNLAYKNKIDKIDTASAYFRKKKTFKKIGKKFKIITKVKVNSGWLSLEFCEKVLKSHFKELGENKVYALLLHDYEILLTKDGLKIFKNLEILKKKYFSKIGISIYDTKKLNYITSNYDIDIVQCPYNILDKRIIASGWFRKLKKMNIEIHARSIFLQGLLVNNSFYKKKYFNKWKFIFSKWFQWLNENKISPIDYCLNDLLVRDFDHIIFGINDYNQLKEIINFNIIKQKKIFKFARNDLKLIDPRNWK